MEKIIFRMNPTFKECFKAQLIGSWLYRRPRLYLVATFGFFLFAAIQMTEFPKYRYIFAAMIFLVLGMWCSAFLRLFENAVTSRKLHKRQEEANTNYFDEEGFGLEGSTYKADFGWDQFIFFKETKNFFFLQYKTDGMLVIFKSSLSGEQVSSVRKLLRNASVKEKHLYADK